MRTMNMQLCGLVCRNKKVKSELTNQEKFERVNEYISEYFPIHAAHFVNKESLLNEGYPYPDYFAAGWVVQEEAQTTKQTVIVVHGSSYVDVNRRLKSMVQKINWN